MAHLTASASPFSTVARTAIYKLTGEFQATGTTISMAANLEIARLKQCSSCELPNELPIEHVSVSACALNPFSCLIGQPSFFTFSLLHQACGCAFADFVTFFQSATYLIPSFFFFVFFFSLYYLLPPLVSLFWIAAREPASSQLPIASICQSFLYTTCGHVNCLSTYLADCFSRVHYWDYLLLSICFEQRWFTWAEQR